MSVLGVELVARPARGVRERGVVATPTSYVTSLSYVKVS